VLDLASIMNGGLFLGASDMHYGTKGSLIMPGRAANMGDGWETRRRRGPGHDWAIVRLGAPGTIRRVEIDTNHFKGNFPDSASIEACFTPGADLETSTASTWTELLPQTKLRASHRHYFSRELRKAGVVSHVRLNIFPDGGISRLRVHGTVAPA
jgi:allantoicase